MEEIFAQQNNENLKNATSWLDYGGVDFEENSGRVL